MLNIMNERFIQLVQDGYFSKINEPSKNEVYRVNKVDDTPTGKVENIVIIKVGEINNFYEFVITNEYIDCFNINVRIHITDILRHKTIGLAGKGKDKDKDTDTDKRTRIYFSNTNSTVYFARVLKFIQEYNEIGEIKTSEDLTDIIMMGQKILETQGRVEVHHIKERFRETQDSLQILPVKEHRQIHREEAKKGDVELHPIDDYIGEKSCDYKASKEEVEADLRRIFT